MKKMLIGFAVMFCVVVLSHAEDLTTKDGNVYKDVKYYSTNPSGVDLSYKKGEETFLTHVYFEKLNEKIQKKFHYSPKKAAIYRHKLHVAHAEAVKRHAKCLKEQKEKNAKRHELESQIEAGRINVVLKIYQGKADGVVAYASSMHSSVTTGHLGKVFVCGMSGMSGGEAASVLYPTGTSRHGYSCYAATLDQAVALSQ
jgi:hypothetical protein